MTTFGILKQALGVDIQVDLDGCRAQGLFHLHQAGACLADLIYGPAFKQ